MKIKQWAFNILIAIDQLGNALTGGDPDETISSRLGKRTLHHGGTIPWSHPISKIVDWFLDKLDPNHSINSIEDDEGKDSVVKPHEHTRGKPRRPPNHQPVA